MHDRFMKNDKGECIDLYLNEFDYIIYKDNRYILNCQSEIKNDSCAICLEEGE